MRQLTRMHAMPCGFCVRALAEHRCDCGRCAGTDLGRDHPAMDGENVHRNARKTDPIAISTYATIRTPASESVGASHGLDRNLAVEEGEHEKQPVRPGDEQLRGRATASCGMQAVLSAKRNAGFLRHVHLGMHPLAPEKYD